jgi:hypothetical protein
VIVGHKYTPEGRIPEDKRIAKVVKWPILTTPKEVRGFLELCGTVQIWIENYSKLVGLPLLKALIVRGHLSISLPPLSSPTLPLFICTPSPLLCTISRDYTQS